MHVEFNTRKKIDALSRQISRLLLSDFPHVSSRAALQATDVYFKDQIDRLDRAASSQDPKFISQVCVSINERIYQYLPILGFLLRSTNNRNAFEAYHSLLDMARALIGSAAEVIVSSEWDFSPLTYPLTVTALPNYVLIGMPSSESSNALIIPLAGHELGHSVWQSDQLEDRFISDVEDSARRYLKTHWLAFQNTSPQFANTAFPDQLLSTDRTLIDVISNIVGLSLSQMEETFCDALGVGLFGLSYAFAFHYLLAPSLGGTRAPQYPPLPVRAANIDRLGGINLSATGLANYALEFRDRQPNLAAQDQFVLDAADAIAQSSASLMFDVAKDIVQSRATRFAPDVRATDAIIAMFDFGVPANNPRSMSDILNAGWSYVTKHRSSFDEKERGLIEWVSELILKSLEVLEYRTRTGNA